MDSREEAKLQKAELELRRGNFSTISSLVNSLSSTPQARLLSIQSELLRAPTENTAMEALQRLTEITPGYASAWCTLSHSAETRGLRKTAFEAAERCGSLWPKGADAARYQQLKDQWILSPLEEARRLLDEDTPALSSLEEILELDPENHDALLLKAQSLLKLDRKAEAEESLALLGDDPKALMLRSRIAMKGGQWQKAMDLLSALPETLPGRDRALHKAHMMWRLSILPAFVREAAASRKLTREETATLLVTLAPDLEALEGRQPPLMPDIIDLPSQRLILTAVRLDLMKPDPVSHLFEPAAPLGPEELQDTVNATSHLLGYQPPLWCSATEADMDHCLSLSQPISGREFVDIMLNLGRNVE